MPAKNIFNSDFYAIRGFSNFVMLCTPVLSEADDKLSFNLCAIMNLLVKFKWLKSQLNSSTFSCFLFLFFFFVPVLFFLPKYLHFAK